MRLRARVMSAVAVAACMAGAATATAAPSTLFSVTARDGVVSGSGANTRISIPSASPLAWFTDRPGRAAGHATALSLAQSWKIQRFDTVPPNAALVTTRAGVVTQTIVVLSRPRITGRRVSFRYRVLDDHRMLGMRTDGRPKPGRYPRVSMFVDSALVVFCPATFDGTISVGDSPSRGYVCLLTANTKYAVIGQSPRLNVQGCHPASSTGGGVQTGGGIAYGYVDWVEDLTILGQAYPSNDYGSTGPLPTCNTTGTAFGQIADEYAAREPYGDGYQQSSLHFTSNDDLTVLTTYRVT